MYTSISRLDYLDGLGTLDERAQYEHERKQDRELLLAYGRSARYYNVRTVVRAVSLVIVIFAVTVTAIAIGSVVAGVTL